MIHLTNDSQLHLTKNIKHANEISLQQNFLQALIMIDYYLDDKIDVESVSVFVIVIVVVVVVAVFELVYDLDYMNYSLNLMMNY